MCPECDLGQHALCIQMLALSCGRAHFKCPHCQNRKRFLEAALEAGIYVQEKDAEWEKPEMDDFYGFADMGTKKLRFKLFIAIYNRLVAEAADKKCEANICLADSRDFEDEGEHAIVSCSRCFGTTAHAKCVGLEAPFRDFVCDVHDQAEEEDQESDIVFLGEQIGGPRIVSGSVVSLAKQGAQGLIDTNDVIVLDLAQEEHDVIEID